MLGEGGEEGEEKELTPEERERSFAEKPVSRRTAIVAAGPLMNLIFPFLLLPLAYLVGVHVPAYLEKPPCVGYVVPDSKAETAGFREGDCLTAINGQDIATWTAANTDLVSFAGSPLDFSVSRDGKMIRIPLKEGGGLEGLQALGILPKQDPVVGTLAPGMPALAAGMKKGDRIVAIGDRKIHSWYDLKPLIQKKDGAPLTFMVQRDGKTLPLTIKPTQEETDGKTFLIGVSPQQETIFKRFGFIEAVRAGSHRAMELITLTLVFIKKLFTGHVSAKNIGGPITVVQIAGQAAQTDLASIFSVLAFLSIQLGILNLFPIPILDGGHLFFNLFELIFRRPLSLRTREIAQQVGLILILMLMVLAFYNDIARLFFGGS
jgi:regulator of sigma E protease